MSVTVEVMREDGADPAVPLPAYATADAAGADIRANLPPAQRDGLTIVPGARALIPTGLRIALPSGYEMQIRPRSGLSLRHGLTVANAPGTVDADYRGPLGVLLVNLGDAPVTIRHGDRIAQAVIAPVIRASFTEAASLGATPRGTRGFGSTGTA